MASTTVASAWVPVIRRGRLRRQYLRACDGSRLCRRRGVQDAAVATHLSSTANPEVKRLVRLQRAAGRRAEGAFVVEGRRAIEGYLAAGWRPRACWLRQDLDQPPGWEDLPLRRMGATVATRCSTHATPPGYLAEFPLPAPATLDPAGGGLVLAGVGDPGNVGTLLRSAAAFGLRQVLLLDGADPFAPKVVQAGSGAQALLALRRVEGADAGGAALADLAAAAPCCALVVDGGGLDQLPPPPLWLVVGSEAHGIAPELVARCNRRLTLPMPGGGESLNAGVAGSIACFLVQGLDRWGG